MTVNNDMNSDEADAKESAKQLIELFKLGARVVNKLMDFISSMRSETFDQLTYSDVIHELMNNKPNDPAIAKGAALKKELAPRKIDITILYLNKDNNPVWGPDLRKPYGCRKRTKSLDKELLGLFEDKDLVIFE